MIHIFCAVEHTKTELWRVMRSAISARPAGADLKMVMPDTDSDYSENTAWDGKKSNVMPDTDSEYSPKVPMARQSDANSVHSADEMPLQTTISLVMPDTDSDYSPPGKRNTKLRRQWVHGL